MSDWTAILKLKKWEETLDYVSRFSLHFFRALAASNVLYNRNGSHVMFSEYYWNKFTYIHVLNVSTRTTDFFHLAGALQIVLS